MPSEVAWPTLEFGQIAECDFGKLRIDKEIAQAATAQVGRVEEPAPVEPRSENKIFWVAMAQAVKELEWAWSTVQLRAAAQTGSMPDGAFVDHR